ERTVEVAVRFRGIPGDFKVLLCAVPLEQRRVAKNAPTVISRIRGEILRNGRRSNERSGDREQQDGQTKAHDRINFSSRTGNGSTSVSTRSNDARKTGQARQRGSTSSLPARGRRRSRQSRTCR